MRNPTFFSPHLKLLVVLVDDEVTINAAWKIRNDNFGVYEDDWRESFPRWDFTRASTGPFSIVSHVNMRYEKYIEAEMEKRFEKEEEDYEDYTSPFFCVRAVWGIVSRAYLFFKSNLYSVRDFGHFHQNKPVSVPNLLINN